MTCHDFYARVYYAEIPRHVEIGEITNTARSEELSSVRNSTVRIEKYCAWRLLEYALACTFGENADAEKLWRDPSGKWRGEGVELSVSHSRGAVAVALSNRPIGVDIEPLDGGRAEKFAMRFLTEGEKRLYLQTPKEDRGVEAIRLWCAKEAAFKSLCESVFAPSALDSTKYPTRTYTVRIGEDDFCLAVCSDGAKSAEVIPTPISDYLK